MVTTGPRRVENRYQELSAMIQSPKPMDLLYHFPKNRTQFVGWLDATKDVFSSRHVQLNALNSVYLKGVANFLDVVRASRWPKKDEPSPIIDGTRDVLKAGTELRKWIKGYNRVVNQAKAMTSSAIRFGMMPELKDLLGNKSQITILVNEASKGFDRSVVEFVSLERPHLPSFRGMEIAFGKYMDSVRDSNIIENSRHDLAKIKWDAPTDLR